MFHFGPSVGRIGVTVSPVLFVDESTKLHEMATYDKPPIKSIKKRTCFERYHLFRYYKVLREDSLNRAIHYYMQCFYGRIRCALVCSSETLVEGVSHSLQNVWVAPLVGLPFPLRVNGVTGGRLLRSVFLLQCRIIPFYIVNRVSIR